MKKDNIPTSELLRALESLRAGTVAKYELVEQSASILFKEGMAWTFNSQIAVRYPLPKNFPAITGAALAEPLIKLLQKITTETVTISSSNSGKAMTVQAGKMSAQMVLSPPTLPVDNIDIPSKFSALPANFISALSKSHATCSSNTNRLALTCVKWNGPDMTGSDGYRLTVSILDMDDCFDKPILIPGDAIAPICQFFPVSFALAKDWLFFKNAEKAILSCRVIDAEYPQTAELLHVKGMKVVFPKKLDAALDRSDAFIVGDTKEEKVVHVQVKDNVLEVKYESAHGSFSEKMQIESEKTFSFNTHPVFLREAVKLGTSAVVGTNRLKIKGSDFLHVVALQ